MKNTYLVLAIAAFVLAFTPNWKDQLHAQTGSYGLDGSYKGSRVIETNSVQ